MKNSSLHGKSYTSLAFKTTIFKAGCFYTIWMPDDDIDDLRFLKVVRSASRQQ